MSTEDVNVNIQAGPYCPSCGTPLQAGDRFCERCGARLEDEPKPDSQATRVELDLAIAAAVSDQGLVHHRNEDSFHLAVTGFGFYCHKQVACSSPLVFVILLGHLPRRRRYGLTGLLE